MSVVIRIVCQVDGMKHPFDGKYLKNYTPKFLPSGAFLGGRTEVADRQEDAKHFPDMTTAWEYWKQEHGVRPWDGKPNRPLTAFTVELITEENDI